MKKGSTHVKSHNKRGVQANYAMVYKNDSNGEFYATVGAAKGDMRFEVVDFEQRSLIAKAMKSFSKGKNKEFITVGAIVLIQPGITKDQYFIQHLYSKDEIAKLGLEKKTVLEQTDDDGNNEEDCIDFDDISNI